MPEDKTTLIKKPQDIEQPDMPETLNKIPKKVLVIFFFLVALGLAELALIAVKIGDGSTSQNKQPSSQQSSSAANQQPTFDKGKYSVNDANSLWVVVNKGRVLPSAYIPANLVAPDVPLRTYASDPEMHVRTDTAKAMEKMFAGAAKTGIKLRLASGYRSYSEQVGVYGAEVKNNGVAGADRESARPGHSEHQTGLAADLEPFSRICEVNDCFATTPEGKWLAANASKYGFIIRYTKGGENLTGYKYEPWHVRYVGTDLAEQINKTGQTLEQFFNLPAYTSYPASSYKLK